MKHIYLKSNVARCLFACVLPVLMFLSTPLTVSAEARFGTLPLVQQNVTGVVTSAADRLGLPGLSIIIKGTTIGTVTNQDGRYSIEAANDAVLVFSFVGFETQEVPVSGRSVIDVVMEESAKALDEVVVTALGIKREEKSLGFSVGRVDGEEFTRVAQENLLSSMAGKVSGVTINSTGGPGSTVSMIIRGATSLSTDNQPLFVVDGVPMANRLDNIGGFGSDNRVDYGNAIADLDPESIESVSVLKGPSAAALYGTRAGNGVVLITTKKAKGVGMKVSVTSNTVFDIPVRFLNTQKSFSTGFFSFRPEDVGSGILPPISAGDATGNGPETDKGYWAVQWDSPLDANGVPVPKEVVSYPDNIRNFIENSHTTTNGVSISNTSELVSYRLGVTNMIHSGLVPNSDLKKNNLSLSASSKVRKNLTVSTDINFVNSYANNRPAGNRGTNPLQWAYNHPLNIDIRKMQDYQTPNGVKRVSGSHENPYFLAYDVNNSFNRYQIFGNLTANWDITPHFSLMGRMTLNKGDEVRETKIAPGYTDEPNNGAYGIVTSNNLERNMDMLATYKHELGGFSISVSAGGNLLYAKASSVSNASKSGSGLVVPNLFTVQNISSGALDYSNFRSQRAIHSVYGMANLGWRDVVYLDLTARNDWSSTLPAENRSYFYPSASLSVILNEIIDMGNQVDMVKLRGGWAQVGNDTSPYGLVSTYQSAGQWGDAVRLSKQSQLLLRGLMPEKATSFEIGPELRLFGDRLRFEGTYFKVDNRNQILKNVPLAVSSGFSSVQLNAGLLQNEGVEFTLGVTPIKTTDWVLDLDFNFTKNDTRILELSEEVEFVEFWDQARVKNIGHVKNDALGHDGRMGNLYSRKVQRVTDRNSPYYGYPILGSGLDAEWMGEEDYSLVGNYNPDFILGLQSALSYKNFTLSMTFDWRSGGQYVSQTMRYLSESVHTQTWLDELVHPGELGGAASDELRDWVVANADKLLLGDKLRPVGGPTPEYGGFPESFSGVTVYDGTFAPGVMGYHEEDGTFVLVQENLGNPGTIFLPYVVSYPWEIGQANMFDADYLKIREVSLNYRLPNSIASRLRMQDVNLSVYSRNIMLWTKDSGLGIDPERAYQQESGRFLQGVERYNAYPWVIPVGFRLGLTF